MFHKVNEIRQEDHSDYKVPEDKLFTQEELAKAGHRLKTGKALDGIANVVLKHMIGYSPEMLLRIFNVCLKKGKFHNDWKRQQLVLLRKGDKQNGISN